MPAIAQTTIEEDDQIIVTAQRRPEAAQDVPISLSAISGEELERLQATDTTSLDKFAPSLVMMRTGPFTQPYLRGVGKRSTLGVENSVATYVDGVYLASAITALLDLQGVERVEVLNGPQGTLFGRNATGGVIQLVTPDPSHEEAGKVAFHAGTDGYLRGDAYLTGGSERIAGNLAMSLSGHDGYGTNLFTGETDQNELDHSFAARSKWVWQPDAPVRLTVAGDYQDLQQNVPNLPILGYPPPLGQPRVIAFRDYDQDTPSRYRFRYGGLSLKADGEIGGLNWMSLTALRGMDAHWSIDLDTGPLPLFSAEVWAEQDQVSQEFQLQSAEASQIRWVAGLYFLRLEEQYDPTTFGYGGTFSARLGGRTHQALFSRGTASSYAAYGQGTVPLSEKTLLTLGLRYTIEHRTVRASGQQAFDNPPPVRPIAGLPLITQEPFRNDLTVREPTWRASLEQHFSGEAMAYVAASRGFQSGGWNLQTPQSPAFGPERLDDFEAGLKYVDGSGRIRADANLFYYDYSDLQVSAITPIGNMTVNAASAEAYGLELQLDARPDRRTNISLQLAWLKTRYNRFPNASCVNYTAGAAVPYAPTVCDVSGNDLPFAPEIKLNGRADREVSLGPSGTLMLSASLSYNSGYFAEPDNVVEQDDYATLDASAEWKPLGSSLSVRLWALNLTGARYSSTLVSFPTSGVFQIPAAPRRVGASIAYDF